MNLIQLNSVGSVIDIEEKIVYPQLINGLPDLNAGVEVYQTSDEWFESLSNGDIGKLVTAGVYDYLK